MEANDPVLPVIDALLALKIPFMLVGSYSSNMHGIPRHTEDADFVVELADAPVQPLVSMIHEQFAFDPQLGFETVTGHQRWRFTHRETGFKIELFLLVPDEYDQTRFQRRLQGDICGRSAWIQTPEDVIVNKARWARDKDRSDIVAVMKVKGESLDWAYIEHWCRHFGRMTLIEDLRRKVTEP